MMGQVVSCMRKSGLFLKGMLCGNAYKPLPGRRTSSSASCYKPLRTHAAAHNFTHVDPYPVPTARATSQLTSVVNARDLAEACRAITPGRVLRAANPIAANEQDVLVLREMLQITRLIDLRSDYERRQDGLGLLIKNAVVVKAGKHKAAPTLKAKLEDGLPATRPLSVETDLTVHYLSLLEKSRYYKHFISSLPFGTAAAIVFWSALFNQPRAIDIAMKEVNAAGLPGLYRTILATAGPELKSALELMTEAAESGETTMFFCKIGKDRTGLLAMLLLSCCGASDDEIVSDYMRSDDQHMVALGGMEKEELRGLDIAVFSRAPPEAMLATLEHLREDYGGVEEYLTKIGFGPESQQRLARALAAPRLQASL